MTKASAFSGDGATCFGFSSAYFTGLTSVLGFLAELGFLGADFLSALDGALALIGVLDLPEDDFAGAFAGVFSAVLAPFTGFLAGAAGDLLVGGFFCLPNSFESAFGLASFESLELEVSLTFLVGFSFDYDGFFLASFSSLAFFCKL